MLMKTDKDGRLMAKVAQTERAVLGSPGLFEAVHHFRPLKINGDGHVVIDTDGDPVELKVQPYEAG